jgi:hypothetical protein
MRQDRPSPPSPDAPLVRAIQPNFLYVAFNVFFLDTPSVLSLQCPLPLCRFSYGQSHMRYGLHFALTILIYYDVIDYYLVTLVANLVLTVNTRTY